MMSYNYNRQLVPRSRDLRKHMTQQERSLWYRFLKDYVPNFQRQKIIDNFIVDFYCSKAKLVIEIDGHQHYTKDGLAYDQIRTQILDAYGLVVLRFTNAEVRYNFAAVCKRIDENVVKRLTEEYPPMI